MDLQTAANIFRALGSEAHLGLFKRLADAAPGLPLSSIADRDALAALDDLQAVGLVRRKEGFGSSWYEANSALLVRALNLAIA